MYCTNVWVIVDQRKRTNEAMSDTLPRADLTKKINAYLKQLQRMADVQNRESRFLVLLMHQIPNLIFLNGRTRHLPWRHVRQ